MSAKLWTSLRTAVAVVAVLSQLLIVPAIANKNSNNGQGHGSVQHSQGVPSFATTQELCNWLCQRQSPQFNYGCPPSCKGGPLDSWSKRAARGRRYDDFGFGFDDYLFMKLLGRNLRDRS